MPILLSFLLFPRLRLRLFWGPGWHVNLKSSQVFLSLCLSWSFAVSFYVCTVLRAEILFMPFPGRCEPSVASTAPQCVAPHPSPVRVLVVQWGRVPGCPCLLPSWHPKLLHLGVSRCRLCLPPSARERLSSHLDLQVRITGGTCKNPDTQYIFKADEIRLLKEESLASIFCKAPQVTPSSVKVNRHWFRKKREV